MKKLENKVCIVTGGAAGIGKKITESMLYEGATVCIFDINEERGAETTGELSKKYGKEKIVFFEVNVADEEQTAEAMESIAEKYGSIDVLVNNAGITLDNLIIRMSLDDWKKVLDINLTGAFICSKQAVKHMLKKRAGRIINISSIVGVRGNAGQCNYSASKAGLIGLTKSLAREVSSRNINVNAIAPGYIETEMTAKLDEKIKEKLVSSIPSGKLGLPGDVASAVVFLAGPEAEYITGTVLSIDGGMGI
ncbi:MAG: 3-oxoacyl-(acyl-carrier-protein) reductase FabG [Actinobacteria bacterium ADurb.Bin346]|nr:MAG: 3-oxoacyl-(acyl-carrier-protein) reductase FabG [Actinobacteria bacterium ADurb.Bin346]